MPERPLFNMTCRNLPQRCHRAAFVPLAQAQQRSTKASAATSSSGTSLDWHSSGTQVPLDDLPDPDGDWSLPFIGETPEFKANHWEWARKRWLFCHCVCLMTQRFVSQHSCFCAACLHALPGALSVSFLSQGSKIWPSLPQQYLWHRGDSSHRLCGPAEGARAPGRPPCSAMRRPCVC